MLMHAPLCPRPLRWRWCLCFCAAALLQPRAEYRYIFRNAEAVLNAATHSQHRRLCSAACCSCAAGVACLCHNCSERPSTLVCSTTLAHLEWPLICILCMEPFDNAVRSCMGTRLLGGSCVIVAFVHQPPPPYFLAELPCAHQDPSI